MGQEDKGRRARIEAEAADWLVRLDSGDFNLPAFERWRESDPLHAAAFAQLDASWSRVDRVAALKPPGLPDPDLLEPLRYMDANSPFRERRRWFLRAAAVGGVALAGVGGGAIFFAGRASAETDVGERRAVRLPDGSLLDLNTDSRASWAFSDRKRQVWLERGEAALEVVVDRKARPFLLNARGRAIVLEQGIFNVRLNARGTDFAVLRGEAEMVADIALPEGRAVTLAEDRAAVRTISPEIAEVTTAWRRGEIIFDGDTLEQAVAEYNRYLTAKIQIDDPSIAGLRLGGRFVTQDPTEFLNSLRNAFPVEVARAADGRTRLSRRPQSH